MAHLRTASLAIALIASAAPLALATDEPAPFPNPDRLHDNAHGRLELRYMFQLDLDMWIKRAKNGAALHYYKGDLKDYRNVARYLVEGQFIPSDPDDPNPRRGAWTGDNPEWETFDEGNLGKSIAVLSIMIDKYGDDWRFRNSNREIRRMSDALRDALDCAYRHQFKPEDGGIAGPWPQSPGWRAGEAKFPFLAGQRTYNDGCTNEIVDGLAIFRYLFDNDEGRIDEAIMLAALGTWQIAHKNNNAMPEQCEPDGTPAWGRAFEPPSLSPRAGAFAAEIFGTAHAISGDDRWTERARLLIQWIDRREVGRDKWEHFLEPGSERPIWADNHFNIVRQRSRAYWPTAKFGELDTYPRTGRNRVKYYLTLASDFVPSDETPPDEAEGQEDGGTPEVEPVIRERQQTPERRRLKQKSVIKPSTGKRDRSWR